MLRFLRKVITFIKVFLYEKVFLYGQMSYSQEGEDILLSRILDSKVGFYVDIGAHHPHRFSNTYYFYKRGWRGINIDALPGSMERFNKSRKFDINIESGVASIESELNYYSFNEPALNTFDKSYADSILKLNNSYRLLGINKIKTNTLKRLLDEHLPFDRSIDFMTIDVEGYDLDVLKSNDWVKFRPNIVLIESHEFDLNKLDENELHLFMTKNSYSIVGKTLYTIFYKDLL